MDNSEKRRKESTGALQVAFELLDQYAKNREGKTFSDLLFFRNVTTDTLKVKKTLQEIPQVAKLQEFLTREILAKVLLQEPLPEILTLVFIGSGDAVLEIFVALQTLQYIRDHEPLKLERFRVILSDLDYQDSNILRKNVIEQIFSIATSVYSELELVWNKDMLSIFPQLERTDNYTNTIFLTFNRGMQIFSTTLGRIDPSVIFMQLLEIHGYNRFKDSPFFSCLGNGTGIWVYSDSLKNFAAKEHPPATNIEDLQGLHSCIQCNSEIYGVVWSELHNPQRIFCGKRCQKVFWSHAAGSKK